MSKPKILVTGASGFIGREVALLLAKDDYRPRLMLRRPVGSFSDLLQKADFFQGDLTVLESLEAAVKGVDCIIHLVARATFESYETMNFIKISEIYLLVQKIVILAFRKQYISQFIFT